MKLTDPQKRVLSLMYKFNCFVHLFFPIRSENETSFFGAPRNGGSSDDTFRVTVRPVTVRKLHDLGLLMRVDENRYLGASKFELSKEGRKIAAELVQDERRL